MGPRERGAATTEGEEGECRVAGMTGGAAAGAEAEVGEEDGAGGAAAVGTTGTCNDNFMLFYQERQENTFISPKMICHHFERNCICIICIIFMYLYVSIFRLINIYGSINI